VGFSPIFEFSGTECSLEKLTKEVLRELNEAYLTKYVKEEPAYNPLDILRTDDNLEFEKKIAWLLSQPEYFAFLCKHVFNVDILPFQNVILQELWVRKYPMLIATRGGSKTFLLALYSLMRALIMPNRRILVAGAAFRQSKFVHEYMETIWKNAPVFRDLIDQDSKPSRSPDMCEFTVNGSSIKCIPIGTGEKIRGYRCQDLIVEEFSSHSREIFETVLAGFGNVSAAPADVVRRRAAEDMARERGIDETALGYDTLAMGNQIVLCGTAFYDFNHFADYWKKYKQIVASKGDPKKVKELFPDGVPSGFNWRDYSILRIPYDVLPRGFMDEGNVARSKASVHSGIFQMEWGACAIFSTPIITSTGIKRIIDVQVGDMVLTHKGRFRPVIKKMFRQYHGDIIEYKTNGYYKGLFFTPEHPFWTSGDDFQTIGSLTGSTSLARLSELSSLTEIDCRSICDNFVDRDDFIYPASSQTKINNNKRNLILASLSSGEAVNEVAEYFNVNRASVYAIRSEKRRPKNSIPSIIRLDYDFGICIGYYASEGSSNQGRACQFALDGHVDKSLDFFVQQLSTSLFNSIGIVPKCYTRKDNTKSLSINSRVFTDVIKHICPGNCYTKLIDHDILFSNLDFLRGFIIGVWNGDGHINDKFATLQMTNKNLVNQIKLALSVFGINASFLRPKIKKTAIIKGKICNLSQAWKITISGQDFNRFLTTFYDKKFLTDKIKNLVDSTEGASTYRIKSKELIPYDGLVYNLEVEEDNSYSTPNATVHNCFCSDSNGFFKRSLIESCVTNEHNEVTLPSGPVVFDAMVKGSSSGRYIMAIDPASEIDNFCIVILELHKDHRRIVHCWTTTRQSHSERVKLGLTTEDNFYSYAARKIRELMRAFQIERIMMDSQGGGIAVNEALHETSNLHPGELPFWPVIDEDKEKPTDDEAGLHIIELVNFAKAEWTSEANHGMRKDLEDKILLFPKFDPIVLGLAAEEDKVNNKLYDTLEDCVMEIEEMKNELVLIEITKTPNGRDRWDTPDIKVGANKKKKMRKDRYSALLMANMGARNFSLDGQAAYESYGGFSSGVVGKRAKLAYIAPLWFKGAEDAYGGY
jgi:intein/homing endonuclease